MPLPEARRLPPLPEPLPLPVTDAHTHLEMVEEMTGTGPDGAMELAAAVGVVRAVTVGTDLETSRWSVAAASVHPAIYAAVAIHPNETTDVTDDDLAAIARMARHPRVRAVGETGLDRYRDWAPVADQERSFRAHVAIAKESGKTLMIHDRDAHEQVLAVLDSEGAPERVVFHCFSGDADLARLCASRGWVLSFAGNVTFRNAERLREAARATPLDQLLVETDAPFLTPAPHRGRPNAPHLVPHTVRLLAEVRGVSLEVLCGALEATSDRMFGPF